MRIEQAALLKEHSSEWMQRQTTMPEGMGPQERNGEQKEGRERLRNLGSFSFPHGNQEEILSFPEYP